MLLIRLSFHLLGSSPKMFFSQFFDFLINSLHSTQVLITALTWRRWHFMYFFYLNVCEHRCCTSLQHLPHHECDPALHGGAVHRRQRVLQVTPQHHPQRWHPLRLRRYEQRQVHADSQTTALSGCQGALRVPLDAGQITCKQGLNLYICHKKYKEEKRRVYIFISCIFQLLILLLFISA